MIIIRLSYSILFTTDSDISMMVDTCNLQICMVFNLRLRMSSTSIHARFCSLHNRRFHKAGTREAGPDICFPFSQGFMHYRGRVYVSDFVFDQTAGIG